MKQVDTALKILLLLFGIVAGAVNPAAAAKLPELSGTEYFAQAQETMGQLSSLHFTLQLQLASPLGQAAINSSGDIQKDSAGYRSRMDSETKIKDGDGTVRDLKMQQYLQETEDAVLLYQNSGSVWTKSSFKKNYAGPNYQKLLNPYHLSGVFGYKDIRVKKVAAGELVLQLTLDNRVLANAFSDVAAQGNSPNTLSYRELKTFFAAMPDVVYELQIEPKTHYVKKITADLSPQLIYGMKAALLPPDKNSPALKAEEEKLAETSKMLQQIKLTVQGEFSLENEAAVFTVPAAVITATSSVLAAPENRSADSRKPVKS